MTDSLILIYDNCPPDVPTLMVARRDKYDMTFLKNIQGDEAYKIYDYLSGNVDDRLVGQVIKELKRQEVPVHIIKKVVDSLCQCIIENTKYKGIHY